MGDHHEGIRQFPGHRPRPVDEQLVEHEHVQRRARGGGQIRDLLQAQLLSVDHQAAGDPHERLGPLHPPHALEDGFDAVQHGCGPASRLLQELELDQSPAQRGDAQTRHALDRATDPVVVRREVDVYAGLRHRHHGDPVAGAQAVDEPGGGVHQAAPLSPRDALLVDQNHDEPAGVGVDVGRVPGILRRGIGREGAPLGRPQRDELGLDDGARLPVDGHREIRRLQVGNRVAVAVDDGGVHLDELDAAPESGGLLGRRHHARGDRGDDEHAEPHPSTAAHGSSSAAVPMRLQSGPEKVMTVARRGVRSGPRAIGGRSSPLHPGMRMTGSRSPGASMTTRGRPSPAHGTVKGEARQLGRRAVIRDTGFGPSTRDLVSRSCWPGRPPT